LARIKIRLKKLPAKNTKIAEKDWAAPGKETAHETHEVHEGCPQKSNRTRMTRITRIGTDKDQVKEIACEKYENRRKRLGRPAATGKETARETHEVHEGCPQKSNRTRIARITRIFADKDQGKEIACEKYENRPRNTRSSRSGACGDIL
jgi:hypothetical protein